MTTTATDSHQTAELQFVKVRDEASRILKNEHGVTLGNRRLRQAYRDGRLRAVEINQRKDLYTTRAWLQAFLSDLVRHAEP